MAGMMVVDWPKQAAWITSPYVNNTGCPTRYPIRHSLIIKTATKILQRNLNSNTFGVWEMKRNVSVVCVWWGMYRRRVIVPIFFDATITTATYMEIFNTFVNQLDDKELSIGYFQQDVATSHSSHASMAEIRSLFGDRVISKGLWPPRSPDLTSPDYLNLIIWYLKGRVYQNKPRNIDALKANNTEEIQAVTTDLLARTFQNMARRVQYCLDANGGHFQHMLWCRHISYTMR